MCGIVGFWREETVSEEALRDVAAGMADTLLHRGPDDAGAWGDVAAGVALAFRRLAILDLSELGHQPMHSASGRYVIVFNGEVYNFHAIREELETRGHTFRGHSDTEVILAAVEQWGVKEAVRRFVGMFAIALWDGRNRTLTLIRDRLGIKPLYYGWLGRAFVFASELKALRAYPQFTAELDRGALSLYVRHGYVPAPHSIYRGIFKLPPGCLMEVSGPTVRATATAYWSAKEVVEQGAAQPAALADHEALDRLDEILRDAVRLRMIADVPLGAFLSGGIDSSLVVALMQVQSARPVKTFSIGFHHANYDEAPWAKAVAQHLGTDHTELYVTPGEALEVIPKLPEIYDEPLGDSSQIPTFLVSQLSRRHVTVSLSGDGGDEVFGGYNARYGVNRSRWRLHQGLLQKVGPALGHAVFGVGAGLSRKWFRGTAARLAGRLELEGRLLTAESPAAMYRAYVSQVDRPAERVIGGWEPCSAFTDPAAWPGRPDFIEQMMYMDTVTVLPDDLLTKVDRASMAVSLEVRVPLLDHRLVEFGWTLPLSQKIHGGTGKWILRQLLHRYVPEKLVERPKSGFVIPVGLWMRGPLRDWVESLLDRRRLQQDGFFHPAPIRACWAAYLAGEQRWESHLWSLLMFQAWKQRWLG